MGFVNKGIVNLEFAVRLSFFVKLVSDIAQRVRIIIVLPEFNLESLGHHFAKLGVFYHYGMVFLDFVAVIVVDIVCGVVVTVVFAC